ncbi:phosphatidylglycerol--membrane-oligosaccharide glycerophosphotransferase [Acerihabitans arboris]|uniref:Phosphatidylglycerol--membrane-oligosaccharide glycerophosphotransferase n=1 Tax=Acerihabitans arboris TaxID=2691583 RepID=A0A845SGM9_9GAMM|nr:phosphatidylglycerol--membrane-oligosaccharide glycerophosphotransferase [Acerihabitans arboris]NDL61848.1 phosphatidylglycerol--membrane-oligosaccharide glycerophosphotransferase [Acerihabitans arboris]
MPTETLSIGFFLAAIILYSAKAKKNKYVFFLVLFLLGIYILLNLIRVASNYFTGAGINDSVLYTVTSSLTGAGLGKYILPFAGFLLASLLVFALMSWLLLLRKSGGGRNAYSLLALLLAAGAVIATPASREIAGLVKSQMANGDTDFHVYYKTPNKLLSGNSPNLIYIYAESLERTYFDQDNFAGLTTALNSQKDNSIDFSNTAQLPGTGYTIAGMVASQCGIPLFAPFDGNASSSLSTFYPRDICLGDILRASGYDNYFYQGADLAFAGKGLFLKSHGFDHIYGFQELKGLVKDPDYRNEWGWYDDTLLDLVYDKFIDLSRNKQRFALFALTVDTHHPDGYISQSCVNRSYQYDNAENSSLSAVACSQEHIARLIKRIRESGYFKNTVIVVSSDHLAMNNTAYDILNQHDRKDLFFIIRGDRDERQVSNVKRSTLDNGATVLDVMGGDNYIGLGRSSLSGTSLSTYFLNIDDKITAWIPDVIRQWDFPTRIKKYKIDVNDKTIGFSGVKFKIPLILKIDHNNIEPMFDVYLSAPLKQQLAKLNAKDKFLWIDDCNKMADVWDASLSQVSNYCVAVGNLSTRPQIVRIDSDVYRGKVSFKKLPAGDEAQFQQTVGRLNLTDPPTN